MVRKSGKNSNKNLEEISIHYYQTTQMLAKKLPEKQKVTK